MAKHSHSQWLNVLTELGVVGLVLFAVAIGGLVAAAFGRLFRDRGDPHRALLAACQAAIVAFVVHMSLDWDWDMTAIAIAFLLLAGVSAAYVRESGRRGSAAPGVSPGRARRHRLGSAAARIVPSLGVRLLATGVILFAVACWALPYLAERDDRRGSGPAEPRAGDRGRGQGAARGCTRPPRRRSALDARRDAGSAGDLEAAAATLDRAVRLQPDNYKPYYQMGNLRLQGFGDEASARLWYQKALELSPMDPGARRVLGRAVGSVAATALSGVAPRSLRGLVRVGHGLPREQGSGPRRRGRSQRGDPVRVGEQLAQHLRSASAPPPPR